MKEENKAPGTAEQHELYDTQTLIAMADPEENKPDGTVLVVDDEESIANIISRILYRNLDIEKEKIVVCNSVRDAIRRLEGGQSPSVIISDVNMPGESGDDFYQYLKSKPQIIKRTLFITGGPGNSERLERFIGKMLQRGKCLEKPFKTADLLGRVNEILGRDQIRP